MKSILYHYYNVCILPLHKNFVFLRFGMLPRGSERAGPFPRVPSRPTGRSLPLLNGYPERVSVDAAVFAKVADLPTES